jgi:hypothetical protein
MARSIDAVGQGAFLPVDERSALDVAAGAAWPIRIGAIDRVAVVVFRASQGQWYKLANIGDFAEKQARG